MNPRIRERTDAIIAECRSIWLNKFAEPPTRAKALRLYADLYEDLHYFERNPTPKNKIRRVIREYEDQLTRLYGEF